MKKTLILSILLISSFIAFISCESFEVDSTTLTTDVQTEELTTEELTTEELTTEKIFSSTTSEVVTSELQIETASTLITLENGTYYINLPNLDKKIRVENYYIDDLSRVTDELVFAAEKYFADLLEKGYPYITQDMQTKRIGLCIEEIVEINPPRVSAESDHTQTSGCGVDHEHKFYFYPIVP